MEDLLVITPASAGPHYISFFKPNFSWPRIRLVVLSHFRLEVLHISLRPHKYDRDGGRKRTNTVLGQLQAQERQFVTLCILRTSVDYRRRVFCTKLLQKPLGMPTHL